MTLRTYVALGTVLLGLAPQACGDGAEVDASEPPEATVVVRAEQSIVISPVRSINGSYGVGCEGRQGSWSLGLAVAPPSELHEPPLRVLTTDLAPACELTLTEVVTRPPSGQGPADDLVHTTLTGILLTGAYASEPVGFVNAGATQFYGNARLVAVSVPPVDFRLELKVSPRPEFGTFPVQETLP